MFFPKPLFMADSMLRHGRAGRVSKSRRSFNRDTEEEVWVYICLVNSSGKPPSTVGVNHRLWTFCTLQASKVLGEYLFISCIFHILNLRMHKLAVV